MKIASDFRAIARAALKGRWGVAVLAGLLATILGGASSDGPEITLEFDGNAGNFAFGFAGKEIFSFSDGFNDGLLTLLLGGAMYIIAVAIVMAVLYCILGSVVGVGYAKFNLDLVDRQNEPELGILFGYFKHWKTVTIANILQTIYIVLWSLLLVIPGICATYSYAMTGYILAENPELSASEAIGLSKEMMAGNRWRLFCLQFSFIGWSILAGFTLGIGNLWLMPYRQAATAAFYRELCGVQSCEPEEPIAPDYFEE